MGSVSSIPVESRAVRRLGDVERAQHLTGEVFPYNLVTSVHLAGAPSEAGLKVALETLQRDHPLLRSAIRGRGRRPVFELDRERAPIPVRSVERLESDTWRGEVERELALPFDARQAPLVRCTRVIGGREPGRHELLFTFHHAIVDGVAVLHFLRRVLGQAARPLDSPRHDGWAAAIPPSADERLPAAYRGLRVRWPSGRFLLRQMAEEVTYRRRTNGLRSVPPEGPFRCRILPLVFEEAETAALVRAARRERVSVWSTLNAAMLLAVVGQRYEKASLPHRYFAFPLLRPYLRPPVPDDVVASYLSILRLAVPVGGEDELWPLAARIHHQTAAAAKRGEKFLAARWGAFSMKAVLGQRACRMGTVALNYAGAIELAATGAALEVEGLHAFVSNFPHGPEFTAQARLFGRRLWLDVLYLDSDMDDREATAMAGEMRRLLAESAAAEAHP